MDRRGSKTSESASANGVSSESDPSLHRAAFNGDVSGVVEILERGLIEPNGQDKHGKRRSRIEPRTVLVVNNGP